VVEIKGKSSGDGMNVSVADLRSWKLLAGVLHTSGSYLMVALLLKHLFIYLLKHQRQRAEATYMPVKSVQ